MYYLQKKIESDTTRKGRYPLRHTCCIELLRNGVPIYTVQRWMRHSSVQTTQNYADLLKSDVGEQVGRVMIP